MSPFLFILCAVILSKLIIRKEKLRNMNEIKIAHKAFATSHLLYVNNILIICRANARNTTAISHVL